MLIFPFQRIYEQVRVLHLSVLFQLRENGYAAESFWSAVNKGTRMASQSWWRKRYANFLLNRKSALVDVPILRI